jgi:hypothetical protein
MGIFKKEEEEIKQVFNSKFDAEIDNFNQLLEVYCSFLKATSNKIKDNDYPNWTILMLLSHTLPLMDNGLELLKKGYLRSSETLIRVVAEAIILSMYFKEFPDIEVEYRTTKPNVFSHRHPMKERLNKVETEGKIFISDKKNAKKINWHEIVFINLYKESCRFLHNDPNVIYALSLDSSNPDSENLIIGPQLYQDGILLMGIKRLLNALLTSLVVLGVSLNIFPSEDETNIMKKSQKIIEQIKGGEY